MKKIVLSIFLAASLASSAVWAADAKTKEPSAQAIQERIQQKGAKAVVNELNKGSRTTNFDRVAKRIETGQADWLKVAHDLAAGTDGGTSTTLSISLATALTKNPAGVLGILDKSSEILTIDEVCTAPFIEESDSFMRSYFSKANKALTVPLPESTPHDIENRRKECLSAMQKTEHEIFKK